MRQRIFNNKIFKYLSVLAFWILVWQITYIIIGNDNLMVSPYNVFICFLKFLLDFKFWKVICSSIIRICSGFFMSVVLGTIFATLTAKFSIINLFFKPIILVIKSIPIVSLIILVTSFINLFFVPTFISFITVLPVIFNNVYQGILYNKKNNSNDEKTSLSYILPYIVSAISSGIGFAWKSGISAEVLVKISASVGAEVYNAKSNLLIPELFTWTAVIVVCCFLLEKLIIFILNLCINKNMLNKL